MPLVPKRLATYIIVLIARGVPPGGAPEVRWFFPPRFVLIVVGMFPMLLLFRIVEFCRSLVAIVVFCRWWSLSLLVTTNVHVVVGYV